MKGWGDGWKQQRRGCPGTLPPPPQQGRRAGSALCTTCRSADPGFPGRKSCTCLQQNGGCCAHLTSLKVMVMGLKGRAVMRSGFCASTSRAVPERTVFRRPLLGRGEGSALPLAPFWEPLVSAGASKQFERVTGMLERVVWEWGRGHCAWVALPRQPPNDPTSPCVVTQPANYERACSQSCHPCSHTQHSPAAAQPTCQRGHDGVGVQASTGADLHSVRLLRHNNGVLGGRHLVEEEDDGGCGEWEGG